MTLDPKHEAAWASLSQDLNDFNADFEPVSLQVQSVLNAPIDLMFTLESNIARRLLTEEAENMAWEFIGNIVTSTQAKTIIAELPYIETPNGLEVQLVFPRSGEASA